MLIPAAPAIAESNGGRLTACWSVAWGIFAVLQITQGIWWDGGQSYPGDIGDGRFNQLVIEHGYQSLRGHYAWASPGQFYPAENTLGLSDTNAGTLPLFAALRGIGLSMDRAWQAWFVGVASLNVISAFRLFAALQIGRSLRGPLVAAGTGSFLLVWLTGTHTQLLPFFPLLLAAEQIVAVIADRNRWRWVAAGGWLAWQFAAGPYLCFFGVFIIGSTLVSGWLAHRVLNAECLSPRNSAAVFSRWFKHQAVGIAFMGGTLAAMVASIYARALQQGAGRAMREVIALAPTWRSWFTTPPTSWWYPAGWPGQDPELVERAWFAGFGPWAVLAGVAVVACRSKARASISGLWLALVGGALLPMLFFTRWGDSAGAWLWLAEHVEPLRAFRSTGRIGALLQLTLIAGAGVALTRARSMARPGVRRFAPLAIAILLATENLAHRQPSTPLTTGESRTQALISAWRAAGDRPILAFAPGFTNAPEPWLWLDAWSAALQLHRSTLNGYSGGLPGSHTTFLWAPTPENARALAAASKLDPTQISIVESYGDEYDARIGFRHSAQRGLVHLDEFQVQPSWWRLTAPLERFNIDGVVAYQFTPSAEIRFQVPDHVKRISYLVGFRPDAYLEGGRTDGAGVSWSLETPSTPVENLSYELIDPLGKPDHRGLLAREFGVPAGSRRILVLRTDTGPQHFLPWDFLLIARLRFE